MISKSIKSGFAQMWAHKRLVLLFYLANLFFGLLIMLPLRSIIGNFVSYSLMGTKLGGRLDMDFLLEFLKYNSGFGATFSGLILIVPIAYWLLALFLSGGAFAVFTSEEKYTPSLFWGNAAKYFGRFFRLLLWCLPVFIVLFLLQFVETIAERIFFGKEPLQYISYWGGWIKVGLRYISILLIGLVFDYARIYTVVTDEHKMRVSMWRSVKFVFDNLPRTCGLAFVLFVLGAVALVIYNPIADLLAAKSTLIILLLFLIQQLYMLFRMMLRLTLYSSQIYLYKLLSH